MSKTPTPAQLALGLLLLLTLIHTASTTTHGQLAQARETLFDFDWRFLRGGAQGAEASDFEDSKWRKVDLPHDWSIEDIPGTTSPFDPNAISQVNGGFTVGGTGWYRKAFKIPNEQKEKRIVIQFDGVYMNAEIWINGQLQGTHPYGYTSFWFDITDKVKFGTENVIAVKVRNEGENSRWYAGSGIYRHVWLKVLDPTHVAQWGTYITTPEVSGDAARVEIKTRVENQRGQIASTTLVTKFLDNKGVELARAQSAQRIEPNLGHQFQQSVTLKSPSLWSPDSPVIYTAISEVILDGQLVDLVETKFGIRKISFDVTNGFMLNGQSLKLKGGCIHHDNGPLGARAYDRAEERRVELLKASGYNALRMAHNPPSPAFLDACDRLGILVIDEAFDTWREPKNPHDYHLFFDEWWQKDIQSMIFRDRNHPSVIMWSTGNEIPNRHTPAVAKVSKELAEFVRRLEPTRPVTSAVNQLSEDKDAYFATLDIGGYNYAADGDHSKKNAYQLDHERVPTRVMVGSESYPLEAFDAWMSVLDHPFVIGDFVWTAFDYLGEASIGWRGYWQQRDFYPWNIAYCGDIDICGWKRPQSYYRDALWKSDQLSIFVKAPTPSFEVNPKRQPWSKWHWHDVWPSWNWAGSEGKPLDVDVYSSCEEVELFLNGKSLGRKPTNRSTKFIATWAVPFQSGVLKAIGYRAGKQVNASELSTAGQPSSIKLIADRTKLKADGQDLSYVTVELLDAKGVRSPTAKNLVNFEISGPGEIVAVGNANPGSLESNQLPKRMAWQGRCLVIIKSKQQGGVITLNASSTGLSRSTVVINSQ